MRRASATHAAHAAPIRVSSRLVVVAAAATTKLPESLSRATTCSAIVTPISIAYAAAYAAWTGYGVLGVQLDR